MALLCMRPYYYILAEWNCFDFESDFDSDYFDLDAKLNSAAIDHGWPLDDSALDY